MTVINGCFTLSNNKFEIGCVLKSNASLNQNKNFNLFNEFSKN